jgi:hypothetical protein
MQPQPNFRTAATSERMCEGTAEREREQRTRDTATDNGRATWDGVRLEVCVQDVERTVWGRAYVPTIKNQKNSQLENPGPEIGFYKF